MPFVGLPDGASSVVIAGMGGFALEVADYLNAELAAHRAGALPLAGVLADWEDQPKLDAIGLPYLGTISDFRAAPGQVIVVAVGSAEGRRSIFERLWSNGNPTPAFYHENCVISPSAHLGRGSFICPFSIVNRNARVEQGGMLNVHCSIGHGAVVGAFSVLCPFSALNGDAEVGEECFLGTRATIYPRVKIGRQCIVDSHSGVRMSVGDRQIISVRGNYLVNTRRV